MAVEQLGQAFVEIVPDTKGFGREAAQGMEKELGPAADRVNSKVGDGMAGAFKKVGAAVAAAGVGAFFKSAVDAATDTAEQVSKVGVVFGDASEQVLDFGDKATESMGASRLEALEATATFGNLLRSVGLSGGAAADMSTKMTQLAGDLASFNNVPVGDALEAIRSGLVGETEPLKKFGVNLNEAALKAEAMALGLDVSGTSLNATTKAQAAYSLIMKQTALAQGDFARTSDSLANQQRILSAEFANAKAEVGQALAPAMLSLVEAGRDLIPLLVGVAQAVGTIGAAVGPVVGVLGKLAGSEFGSALVTFGTGAGIAYVALSKLHGIVGPMITAIGEQLAASAAAATAMTTEAVATEAATVADVGQAASSQAAAAANLEQAAAAEASGAASAAGASGVGKLAGTVGKATAAIGGFGPAAVVAATAVGIGVLAMRDHQQASKELAEQQAKVNKALAEAGDPAQMLAAKYDEIGAALAKVPELQQGVADAKSKDAVATNLLTDALAGQEAAMSEAGLSMDSVKRAVLEGGDAFDGMLQHLNQIDPATGGLKEGMYNLSGAIQTVEQDLRDADTEAAKRIKTTLEAAEAQGLLSQAEIDRAKATSGSKDADQQWIAAGTELEGTMQRLVVQRAADAEAAKRQAEATDQAVASAVQAIDPTARLAAKTKELEAAEKDVKDATDQAKRAQDEWLFGTVDFQAELDDTTKAVRDMKDVTKEMSEEQVQAALAGTDNSVAALKVRDAYQQVTHEAVDAVKAIGDTSATAQEATDRTAAYAQQQYELAIAYGMPEAEAAKVRDTILSIPSSHPSDIDVKQHGAEVAKAEIDSAARDRETEIAVSFKAQNLGVMNSIREQMGLPAIAAAGGAMVRHRAGGILALVGEGGRDEAIVPMGPSFAADLARIVGPKAMAQLGGGSTEGGPTIIVNIAGGGVGSLAEAQHLGRIVGETAAQVLAQRQLATSVRVA
jgi:hypothetical protein